MLKPTKEVFLNNVSNHTMKVLLDNGVYRHLRFTNKGSSILWFDVVTWPGFLAYSGDMGCFVFSRIEDMFEFFRTKDLSINPGYWGEKLQSVDNDSLNPNYKKFSWKKFWVHIEETLEEWVNNEELNEEEVKNLREIVNEYFSSVDENENEAYAAASNFSCTVGNRNFQFQDSWEWNCKEYTYRFIWCCYAITWAIQKYDSLLEEILHDYRSKSDNKESSEEGLVS
jgi:hypothetical protein